MMGPVKKRLTHSVTLSSLLFSRALRAPHAPRVISIACLPAFKKQQSDSIDQAGFTLIELIMVITLLSILSVLGGSRFFEKDAFSENFVFDETVAALRYAQSYALLTGCEVEFAVTSTGYTLNRDANCTTGGVVSFTLPVKKPTNIDEDYENQLFPDSLAITSTSLVFFPQGWCEDALSAQSDIAIAFVGKSTRTLNIVCATGYVYES